MPQRTSVTIACQRGPVSASIVSSVVYGCLFQDTPNTHLHHSHTPAHETYKCSCTRTHGCTHAHGRLDHNDLERLPVRLYYLTQLQVLEARDNPNLTVPPASISLQGRNSIMQWLAEEDVRERKGQRLLRIVSSALTLPLRHKVSECSLYLF
jgi:hypothetical protein